MNGKSFTFLLLIFLSALFVISSFVLVLTHNSGHCTFSIAGGDEKKCAGNTDYLCNGPALVVDVVLENSIFTTHKVCPWRDSTSVITYVSFGFCMLFLLLLSLSPLTKSANMGNVQFAIGLVAVISLIFTLILMIYDMIHGEKASENFYLGFVSVSTSQAAFRINASLIFAALVTMTALLIMTYVKHQRDTANIVKDEDAPFHSLPVVTDEI